MKVKSLKSPKIYKYLDVSTGHLTRKDVKLLEKHFDRDIFKKNREAVTPEDGLIVFPYDTGFFVYVNYSDKEEHKIKCDSLREDGLYSEDFINILELTCKYNCWFVRFDSAAEEYEELPSHEWEYSEKEKERFGKLAEEEKERIYKAMAKAKLKK